MSSLKTKGKEESRRINLTLPFSLYAKLEKIRQENDLKMPEALRNAVEFWVEYELTQFMAEGYRENAKDSIQLMDEFKHVDKEIW